MPITAYKYASAVSDIPTGDVAWSNPSYAEAEDGVYALADVPKTKFSDGIRLTSYGFTSSDIPAGATILGIELSMLKYYSGATNMGYENNLQLRKTSGSVGDNKASGSYWPPSPTVFVYGGSRDGWNANLLQSDIVSSDFGLDFSLKNDSGSKNGHNIQFWVDYLKIRVYYTLTSNCNGVAYASISKITGVSASNINTVSGVK